MSVGYTTIGVARIYDRVLWFLNIVIAKPNRFSWTVVTLSQCTIYIAI